MSLSAGSSERCCLPSFRRSLLQRHTSWLKELLTRWVLVLLYLIRLMSLPFVLPRYPYNKTSILSRTQYTTSEHDVCLRLPT